MKKLIYSCPEIEIVKFNEEDILTDSTPNVFDPENILDGEATSWWDD